MADRQAENQLILLSAGTAARREQMRGRATTLVANVDWLHLAKTLRVRRLLPTLGPRIVELAGSDSDGAFGEAVEQALITARRHGGFLQLVTLRAMAMLSGAGIRSVPLKGPLMAETLYGDPGRRPSTDIDLLVPAQQLRSSVEVIREMSYGSPIDHVYDTGLPLLHFVLVHERRELPAIELHWRVHWYERCFANDRLLPPDVDDTGDWWPAPVDELASLLLFYARDGFIDLRLATDLGAWWDLHGSDLPAGALDGVIANYPALARVLSSAALVAGKVVGLPAEHLLGRSLRDLRGRVAVRLANPNPRSSLSQLYADIGFVDGLLAPPGGFRDFIHRQVLPPPEVLEQNARHRARARARSPWSRGVGILARYGVTLTRLARSSDPL
jgi:hypothetical protein